MPPKKKATVEKSPTVIDVDAEDSTTTATISSSAVLAAHAVTPVARQKEIEKQVMSLAVGYGDADLVQVLSALGFGDFDRDGNALKSGEALALAKVQHHMNLAQAAAAGAGQGPDNAAGNASSDDE